MKRKSLKLMGLMLAAVLCFGGCGNEVASVDGSSESIIGLENCVFFASVISPYRNHIAVEPNAGVFFVATGDQPTELIKEFEGVVKIEIK